MNTDELEPNISLSIVPCEQDYFLLEGAPRPLIPEGQYCFKLVEHRTARMFGIPKLIFLMSVIDLGEYHGSRICRYYNVKQHKGKVGKRGKFIPPRNGDFMIDYFTLVHSPKMRIDRVPLSPLYNSVIVGDVSTVKKNNQGKILPDALHYSKVSKLIRLQEDINSLAKS